MKPHILIVSFFALAAGILFAAEESTGKGQQMAVDLWKASGGENWSTVKELDFTFAVESEGKPVFSAQHAWKVKAGTDEVKWKDKEGKDHQVTVSVTAPGSGEEERKAYARWVNDSYWLLAPLKIRDNGVQVEAGEPKEMNGRMCETIRLKFGSVGLTPTDQYVYYIDPKTHLPVAWDYIPESGTGMQATWEKFESFGGLTLATEHNFNGKTIRLENIKVITDN